MRRVPHVAAEAPAMKQPDMIRAILGGDEPGGLSLEKLRKDLPVRWEEQRMCWIKGYGTEQVRCTACR